MKRRTLRPQHLLLIFAGGVLGLVIIEHASQKRKIAVSTDRIDTHVPFDTSKSNPVSLRDHPAFPWLQDFTKSITVQAGVMFTRVPKTGSYYFQTSILVPMAKANRFLASGYLLREPNLQFWWKLSDHIRYVNRSKVESRSPRNFKNGGVNLHHVYFQPISAPTIWISNLRDPITRLHSYWDALRKDSKPAVRGLTHWGDDINKCFEERHPPCMRWGGEAGFNDSEPLWWIPHESLWYIGGGDPHQLQDLKLALNKSLDNLYSKYLLIGVQEQMEDFLLDLSFLLPKFFRGIDKLKGFHGKGANSRRNSSLRIRSNVQNELYSRLHQDYVLYNKTRLLYNQKHDLIEKLRRKGIKNILELPKLIQNMSNPISDC